MNWKLFCQFVVLALMTFGLLSSIRSDFHGRKAIEPGGFPGFIAGVIVFGLAFAAHVVAGTFSEIFGN